MRGRRVAVVVMLFIAGAVRAQTRGAVDWIFLVDTSKSMRGVGKGTKDIFGDVKASIETFVREASAGDSVSVYTFDRDVRSHGLRDIGGELDRSELFDTIRGLEANGNRTYLGAAIAKGLERSESLQQLRNDPTRTRAVVLFTDGKEDVRGIPEPISIPSNVDRALKSGSRMFFVSLGEHEHEVQLDAFPNATVLRAHDAEAIRRIAQEIRQKIVAEKPAPPPPVPVVKVAPVPVKPLPPPSPFVRLAKWIGAIAVLLLLGAIALVLYTGKMPGELLASIAERDTLEGELEIVKPRVASEAAFVGLPNMHAKELVLSAIVPIDALAGNDARLFVRRKSGEKKIWIAAQSGTLRVNDVELPMSELYDADTIRIGDATLRFNRIGHQRPDLSGGELS